ncbi:hypothetical protein NPIL_368551 [Nephila pilipes]|uniref:Uncharacterized protein n=1 Tax=Nephila pilipes TaxID=299642 RepID=A0A8X6N328_NEPPI|nr:hypothetical protein NPIL_368551 [Nephila pilipes]
MFSDNSKSCSFEWLKTIYSNTPFHQLLAEFSQLTETSITTRKIKPNVELCIETTEPPIFSKSRQLSPAKLKATKRFILHGVETQAPISDFLKGTTKNVKRKLERSDVSHLMTFITSTYGGGYSSICWSAETLHAATETNQLLQKLMDWHQHSCIKIS